MTARLIHVGVRESLARRQFPEDDLPVWADEGDDQGTFLFRQWTTDQGMATLTSQLSGDQHIVKVTIAALFEFVDEEMPHGDERLQDFFAEQIKNLLPFLRQAVYTASSQVWPVKPIMMDTVAATEEQAAARRAMFADQADIDR